MKTEKKNYEVAQGFDFDWEPQELTLDGWGRSDFYCIKDNVLVILEVEKGQKHPNTNVTKIWPYLDTHPEKKILLIHVICSDNSAPKNRIKLSEFIGNKMMQLYQTRFLYYLIEGTPQSYSEHNDAIKSQLIDLL